MKMVTEEEIYLDLCKYFLNNANKYQEDIDLFRRQLPTLENLLYWLKGRQESEFQGLLIKLISKFAPILEMSSQQIITTIFVEDCILFCTKIMESPFELAMIAYRAYWAVGEWGKAEIYLWLAIECSADRRSIERAQALQSLGSLQINKGEFKEALTSLHLSRTLFADLGDVDGENDCAMEEAAYYLDRGEFVVAERMYREIGNSELTAKGAMSNHSLQMIGVAARRQGKNGEAIPFFEEILRRGQFSGNLSDEATAKHHLAWVYLNLHDYALAKEYALESQNIYNRIDDLRGESDVDEQLGEIAMAIGDRKTARYYYECCANIREKLHNNQGLASVLRRLVRLYLHESRLIPGFYYLIRCTCLYLKNGMLTKNRVRRGFREILLKTDIAAYPR